jgi:hypothetical protein
MSPSRDPQSDCPALLPDCRLAFGRPSAASFTVPVLWAFRTGRHDLASVEPFRLAAEGLHDKIRDRAQLMILVTGVRVGDEELLILASDANAPASSYQVGADDVIDLACSVRSGLFGLN